MTMKEDFWLSSIAKKGYITLNCILIMASFAVNIALIITLLGVKTLRTIPNIQIVSLSIADALVGAMVCLQSVLRLLSVQLNTFWCNAIPYLKLTFFGAAVLSLLSVCRDRYCWIVKAATYRPTIRGTVQKIVIFWLFSLLYGLRIFLHIDLSFQKPISTTPGIKEENGGSYCSFLYKDNDSDVLFKVIDFIILLLCPASFMIYFASRVQRCFDSFAAALTHTRRKLRVVKMISITIFFFCFCWFPFYINEVVHGIMESLDGEDIADNVFYQFGFITSSLIILQNITHPVVYLVFNRQARYEIRELLRRLKIALCSHHNNRVTPFEGNNNVTSICVVDDNEDDREANMQISEA